MLTAGGSVVPRDHVVAFYDHDADLVACLADFVAEGLRLGEGVVVVATPVHREALAQALVQRGLAVDLLSAAGRYRAIDAAQTLQTFLVEGTPAALPFADTVGPLLDRAASGGRPVRVFGEMVALLWEQGEFLAAIELEMLWNSLAQDRRFLLLCAYASATLTDGSGLERLADVCHGHSAVLPPGSYGTDVVVLGRPDGPAGRTETFVPVPESIRVVRRFVTCTLRAWQQEALVPDAELVASELATNAIRHARSPFRVSVSRSGRAIRLSVDDVGSGLPRELGETADGVSGRGVALVAALSQRWGIERRPDGKTVWAELVAGGATAVTG